MIAAQPLGWCSAAAVLQQWPNAGSATLSADVGS